MADLLINGKDAYLTWGVRMGQGFIDALDTPLTLKEYISNESRLEHGKRVIAANPKIDSRTLTLPFTIEGSSQSDYRQKKKAFEQVLYSCVIDVQVPNIGQDVFHLCYRGQCSSYGQNKLRTFGKFSAKFEEPNPSNRL